MRHVQWKVGTYLIGGIKIELFHAVHKGFRPLPLQNIEWLVLRTV